MVSQNIPAILFSFLIILIISLIFFITFGFSISPVNPIDCEISYGPIKNTSIFFSLTIFLYSFIDFPSN
jgi:hypothetical protein